MKKKSTAPPKPTALIVNIEAVPEELRREDRWVCWRYKWIGRKWDKKPVHCRTGKVTVIGKQEVKGQGPFGTMRADRFHIVKGTKHIYLDGHVRMVLYPTHGTKPGKPTKKT